jgi:hypothetical protein
VLPLKTKPREIAPMPTEEKLFTAFGVLLFLAFPIWFGWQGVMNF